jgi:hypothetical protein
MDYQKVDAIFISCPNCKTDRLNLDPTSPYVRNIKNTFGFIMPQTAIMTGLKQIP